MSDSHKQIEDQIGREANRRIRARREGRHQVWFGLGMFGLVGWSVAVPAVVGAAVGAWIDARWEGRYSWTLMLLIGGLVMGCINAWQWLQRESKVP
jgi:ATP synthase protein I